MEIFKSGSVWEEKYGYCRALKAGNIVSTSFIFLFLLYISCSVLICFIYFLVILFEINLIYD